MTTIVTPGLHFCELCKSDDIFMESVKQANRKAAKMEMECRACGHIWTIVVPGFETTTIRTPRQDAKWDARIYSDQFTLDIYGVIAKSRIEAAIVMSRMIPQEVVLYNKNGITANLKIKVFPWDLRKIVKEIPEEEMEWDSS